LKFVTLASNSRPPLPFTVNGDDGDVISLEQMKQMVLAAGLTGEVLVKEFLHAAEHVAQVTFHFGDPEGGAIPI
jgi:hypothetical protein